MAVCFGVMWVTAIYQLWFAPPPPLVAHRTNDDISIDG
jgi:hypothetical protein